VSCRPNFKSDLWKTDKTVRQNLATDLVKSQILIDKTYNEIFHLLGESDLDSRINDSSDKDENYKIQYILGGCNFIDFERLVIEFKDEKSIEAYKSCD